MNNFILKNEFWPVFELKQKTKKSSAMGTLTLFRLLRKLIYSIISCWGWFSRDLQANGFMSCIRFLLTIFYWYTNIHCILYFRLWDLALLGGISRITFLLWQHLVFLQATKEESTASYEWLLIVAAVICWHLQIVAWTHFK